MTGNAEHATLVNLENDLKYEMISQMNIHFFHSYVLFWGKFVCVNGSADLNKMKDITTTAAKKDKVHYQYAYA